MKKLIFIFAILLSISAYTSEPVGNFYWVSFNTKSGTPYSLSEPDRFLSQRAIERRNRQGIGIDSTDLPVNPVFIDSLTSLGLYVKHTSRWMNGAIVIADSLTDISTIEMPSFVANYELRKDAPVKSTINKFEDEPVYNEALYGGSFTQISMMGGHHLHQQATGKGVHVAVIDAGFIGTNTISTFDSLYTRNGVLGTFDFVNPGGSVYAHHYHGNAVLSIMAGNRPGELIGSAPDASYWLLRSEDVSSEYPIEEDYWIIAAEFADSVGCDVINTSLGYSEFDNPQFNHTYADYTGNTLRVSQAANMAVRKGIVLSCSAGNSGNDPWRHIVAPSEAELVLSVAAVDANENIASFSSRGFEGEGYLSKPDISAMGRGTTYSNTSGEIVTGNGTSFSSPLMAGMAACLVEMYPEKSAIEISDLIRSLGDRYPEHSLEYGYGIPSFTALAGKTSTKMPNNEASVQCFPNPFSNNFKLSFSDEITQIKLVNVNGRTLYSEKINGEIYHSPNLSHLDAGIYFAILKGDKETRSIKIIKQ